MAPVTRPLVEQTTLDHLVSLTLAGDIRIPSFQRPYVWGREHVVKLFESVLRGYPVGNLVVSQRPADASTYPMGPLTITADAKPSAYWVIDGQQRIISLVGALAAPPETTDPRFRVFFDPAENTFVSADRHQHIPEHWFPLPAALHVGKTLAWQQERPWLTTAELARCHDMVTAVRGYPIAMHVIEGNDAMYSEIFQRINSSGVSLRRDEIDNARRAGSDQTGTDDLGTLGSAVRRSGFGTIPKPVLIRSVLATREDGAGETSVNWHGNVPSLSLLDDDDRRETFRTALRALGAVIDFLRDEAAIPHAELLPHLSFLPILVRFAARFGPPEGRAAELLRRWVWRGSVLDLTQRNHASTAKRYGGAITDDPVASADRLLGLLPPYQGWEPDLSAIGLGQVRTKVNLLGMLSRRPRVLTYPQDEGLAGTVADPRALMEQRGGPLLPIVTDGKSRYGPYETVANCLLHPRNVSAADVRRALSCGDFDPEVLESHLIDERGLELWREGLMHEFIGHRAKLIQTAVTDHVQENALFGFPDGPGLTDLIPSESI